MRPGGSSLEKPPYDGALWANEELAESHESEEVVPFHAPMNLVVAAAVVVEVGVVVWRTHEAKADYRIEDRTWVEQLAVAAVVVAVAAPYPSAHVLALSRAGISPRPTSAVADVHDHTAQGIHGRCDTLAHPEEVSDIH